MASAGPKCWWSFHRRPLLLTNLAVEVERPKEQEVGVELDAAREPEVDVEQEQEGAKETEEVMDVEVAPVQEVLAVPGALGVLEVPLEEWAEQVLQVQMAIVHGMVRGDVMGMVEAGDGVVGMEVWDLLDLITTQPGMDPEEEVEAADVAEVGEKDLVDQLEELVE